MPPRSVYGSKIIKEELSSKHIGEHTQESRL